MKLKHWIALSAAALPLASVYAAEGSNRLLAQNSAATATPVVSPDAAGMGATGTGTDATGAGAAGAGTATPAATAPADASPAAPVATTPAAAAPAESAAPKSSSLPSLGSETSSESAWSKYGPYNVYLGAGTTGGVIGTSFAGRSWVNGRLEYNSFSFNTDDSTNSIDYKVDLRLRNQAAYVDLRPFAGTFRFTVGISSQQSNLFVDGTTDLDNNAGKANVKAKIELPSSMPYVGFGFGLGKNTSGLGMFADIGAFLGTPKVTQFSLTSTNPALQPQAQSEEAQKRKELEDDVSKLKLYPVVKLGITYHF